MRFCPFAQRIHLVLDVKKIPYTTHRINLHSKPEWLSKFSKSGKVPALGLINEPGHPWITDSMIVADYLDDKYPGDRRLNGTDPVHKAIDRVWIQQFETVILGNFFKVAMIGLDKAPNGLKEIADGLDCFEEELRARKSPFYGGDQPNMFDYMIWPFCERVDSLKYIVPGQFEMNKERYPKLVRIHFEWGYC